MKSYQASWTTRLRLALTVAAALGWMSSSLFAQTSGRNAGGGGAGNTGSSSANNTSSGQSNRGGGADNSARGTNIGGQSNSNSAGANRGGGSESGQSGRTSDNNSNSRDNRNDANRNDQSDRDSNRDNNSRDNRFGRDSSRDDTARDDRSDRSDRNDRMSNRDSRDTTRDSREANRDRNRDDRNTDRSNDNRSQINRDRNDSSRDSVDRTDNDRSARNDRRNDQSSSREAKRELRTYDLGLGLTNRDNRFVVSDLRNKGIAARAGFRDGDVIESIGDHRIRSRDDFLRYIYPGRSHRDYVEVIVLRDGEEQTVRVDPQMIYDEVFTSSSGSGQAWLGVVFDERYRRAAVIARVIEGSPAERAGIRTGDVVTVFDKTPVESSTHLRQLVDQEQPGDDVDVEIRRERQSRNLDVTLGER